MIALTRHLPRVAARIPWVPLGHWPTPIQPLVIEGRTLWVKDEGVSHPHYGGNKIRTLEVWLGHARARDARRIWAIGAYGSNHAIATVLHAPAAGLAAGAIVFPQPTSEWAVENCGALIASGCPLICVPSVAVMPFAAVRLARKERDGVVMSPGGATPIGTIGALNGAFELADQIAEGHVPAPRRLVVAVGSACTIAGLIAGLALAHAVGVWRWPLPVVHGVRVTPWPVTAPLRIANLVWRTLHRLERLGAPHLSLGLGELRSRFVIDGRELGAGYGRPTTAATHAIRAIQDGPRLDGVYSAKAAAAVLRLHRAGVGPLLFWATKSTARLPPPSLDEVRAADPVLQRWLRG